MEFFTSPEDLSGWVRSQDSADSAAIKIMEYVGTDSQQDITDTCRSIYDAEAVTEDAKVLWGVLAKNNPSKIVTASNDKMTKEAQSQRMGLYNDMDKRICPKLPRSSSIISTWNCREHCLDSLVLDDDPTRVYCKEALWRRHVMDKFSREFKDKEGKWVGGYINERFVVEQNDGGNQMELANGERTRNPRPHQYSTERRLEEARGEETTDIKASVQNNSKIVKLASSDSCSNDDKAYQIFDDVIEMTEAGLSYDDILTKVSEHYDMSITSVASIHKMAMHKIKVHSGAKYAFATPGKMEKTSELMGETPEGTLMMTVDYIPIIGMDAPLDPHTQLEVVNRNSGDYKIVQTEQPVRLANAGDFTKMVDVNIEAGAEDVGLLEDIPQQQADPMADPMIQASDNFSITEE